MPDEVRHYALSLKNLQRFEEVRALFRKVMPAARRVLGENNAMTLCFRKMNAMALYEDAGATLNDLPEAATTLEDLERTARRVFGGAHPLVAGIERNLRKARAALRAREARERECNTTQN